ncbi:MAG: hypothetical protein KatS3mg101_0548 [Patescibacteria group bacterium]|nr:MAG: hypothetical protein KatS3mg101_0548 [Patescibacteria group bacterium]
MEATYRAATAECFYRSVFAVFNCNKSMLQSRRSMIYKNSTFFITYNKRWRLGLNVVFYEMLRGLSVYYYVRCCYVSMYYCTFICSNHKGAKPIS